jgi:hypothetical protein
MAACMFRNKVYFMPDNNNTMKSATTRYKNQRTRNNIENRGRLKGASLNSKQTFSKKRSGPQFPAI